MFLPCRGLVNIDGSKLLFFELSKFWLAQKFVGEHSRKAEIVKSRKKALIVRKIDELFVGWHSKRPAFTIRSNEESCFEICLGLIMLLLITLERLGLRNDNISGSLCHITNNFYI